ncbi:MAG: sensor histidine kinase, partial [Chloroflexota bacterium]
MTAQDLLTYTTWALYLVVFVVTLAQAARHPRKSTLDTAILFGAIGLISAEGAIVQILNLSASSLVIDLVGALLLAMPYLLLRMVEDFSEVPRVVSAGAVLGLALSIVGLFASSNARPGWLDLLLVLYFVALTAYAAVAFTVEAFRSRGVTQRRMTAVAAGTGAIALAIALAGVALPLQVESPGLVMAVTVATQVCAFISGAAYYIGFATPRWLRRACQEPELYAFLARAAELPRLPDTPAIVRELEDGAATSLGAWLAAIGLYEPTRKVLLYDRRHRLPAADSEVEGHDQGPLVVPADDMLVGRVLREQRPLFSPDARRANPAESDMYQRVGLRALLAAPITAGHTPLGVLSAVARTTIFAEEDLSLLTLLANQAAVILESRNLIDEAAAVRAHEEANRMRDDFLSAAAHDLKTPLTSIFGQAQLLLRQAERAGDPAANAHGLQVIVDQTRRLRDLVNLLLDANRVERGSLLGVRQRANLGDILQSAAHDRPRSHHH